MQSKLKGLRKLLFKGNIYFLSMHKSPHFPNIERNTTLMVRKITVDVKAQDTTALPEENKKCAACMEPEVRRLH